VVGMAGSRAGRWQRNRLLQRLVPGWQGVVDVSDLEDRIRSIADMFIEQHAPSEIVRMHILIQTGVAIGGGGAGTDPSIPGCPYCGASNGGGHGGRCPNA
jgi:hypothetical protein